MKKIIKWVLICFALTITIKAFCQNAEIDTISDMSLYKGYLERSNYLIALIEKGDINKALGIYYERGNFYKRGKGIEESLIDFHKLISKKNRKVYLVKIKTYLPRDKDIPSFQFTSLEFSYLYPSIYKGINNSIIIDYPINFDIPKYSFDMLFYKASDEYETRRLIDSLPVPKG